MGTCGSTTVSPYEEDPTLPFLPSRLTVERLKTEFPEFAKDLNDVHVIDLTQTLAFKLSDDEASSTFPRDPSSASSSSKTPLNERKKSNCKEMYAARLTSFKYSVGSIASSVSTLDDRRAYSSVPETRKKKMSMRMTRSTFIQELRNGGSETGAQLRRLELEWNDDDAAAKERPLSIIAKSSDLRDIPHMSLLKTTPWLLRWIVRRVLAGKKDRTTGKRRSLFLWDLIPRMMQSEIRFHEAVASVPKLRALAPKLYFSKVVGDVNFPSIDEWVSKGMRSIPTYFLLIGIEEIDAPFYGAEGNTGNFTEAALTDVMIDGALRGLARWHAATWIAGPNDDLRKHPLVRWIKDVRPAASTLTFFYPIKYGLWPDNVDLGDFESPLSRLGDDAAFERIHLETHTSALSWGLDNVCATHAATLRALQPLTPSILRQCPVTDAPTSRDCRTPQCVLHGDAHGWNMFWNSEVGVKDDDAFRMIDFSNLGVGRVAWEFYYFMEVSAPATCFDEWSSFVAKMRTYHDALAREIASDFGFDAFKREVCALILLHTVHHLMKLFRSGKYGRRNRKKLVELTRKRVTYASEAEREASETARKDLHRVKIHTSRLIALASQVLANEDVKRVLSVGGA